MQKQNDTVLHGVVIRRGNEWAAPMIPIDYMASAVQKGSSSVTDVVQEIIHIYKTHETPCLQGMPYSFPD